MWRYVLSLAILCALGCGQKSDKQLPAGDNPGRPWVVYHESYSETKFNRDALASLACKKSGNTVMGGGSWGDITIMLDTRQESLARPELVEIANELNESLPAGCPFRVEVQTVSEAIEFRKEQIKREEAIIQRILEKHG